MNIFEQQLQRARAITPEVLEAALFEEIRAHESEILKLNKNQISLDSSDVYGNPLGYYSAATEMLSGGRKKKGDPFTGIDTGNWLKGFYVKIENNTAKFGSTDSKNDTILKSPNWLSNRVFGLSDEDLKVVIKVILKPFIIKYSKSQLGL